MVKEAIMADVGLTFRADAFHLCPGVLAAVGPDTCHHGGIHWRLRYSPLEMVISEFENILGISDGTDLPLEKRFNTLDAWTKSQPGDKGLAETRPQDWHILVRDSCGDIRDQLREVPTWWFLEILPLWERRVGHDGSKSSGFRYVASSHATRISPDSNLNIGGTVEGDE